MKSMKLYAHVERIHNELRALGIGETEPLSVSQLTPFDQYHYFGTAAVDEAIEALGLRRGMRVLEIGSGIGGPARYLAATTGCELTALELQPDLHETARNLTGRCGLAQAIDHRLGDILHSTLAPGSFDAIVSFLVFLHIMERNRLFTICHRVLKDGGKLYIEDFVLNGSLSERQSQDLKVKVMCPYLPDEREYRRQIEESGLVVESFIDMTEPWTRFTAQRLDAFRAQRDRHLKTHGEAVTDGLDDFYGTVAGLFASGVLGGARVVARRP